MKNLNSIQITEIEKWSTYTVLITRYADDADEVEVYRANGRELLDELKNIFGYDDFEEGHEGLPEDEIKTLFLTHCQDRSGDGWDLVQIFEQ